MNMAQGVNKNAIGREGRIPYKMGSVPFLVVGWACDLEPVADFLYRCL